MNFIIGVVSVIGGVGRQARFWPAPAVLAVLTVLAVPAAVMAAATAQAGTGAGTESTCTGQRFTDVCPGDWYYPYVMDLTNIGAVSGYADGTFRPGNTLTRGQAVKVVVISMGLTGPVPPTPTFADVPRTQAFFQWVEVAAANGVVNGYACGGPGEPCDSQHRPYFRPGANVNRGQLAKMVVLARRWTTYRPPTPTFNDVPPDSVYYGYVERVAAYSVIGGYTCGGPGEPCPGRYFRPTGTATRAQAAKIISIARVLMPPPEPTAPAVSPTPTVAVPTPVGTRTGGCSVFPANNIWNRNIAALPTHALSNNYIASIGASAYLHADFGSGTWNGGPIGIPFVTVPGTQPRVPIYFTDYPDESDPGPYPVPTNAPIEGGPNGTGDRHVLVIDRDNCVLYEMFYSFPQPDGSWRASAGARWPLTSNALRPAGWTSADAAGLPIYAGLVRYDEVAGGAIRHALRFTAPRTQRAYLWPARHYASTSTDPNLPPMGLRVRLKAGVDISGYPQQVRVILQALKDYGMFLADNGSAWYISGAPDERWNNDTLRLLHNLRGSDFEAVDESSLMVHPDSGESR
jgi:hypothetical protein